VNRNGQQLVTNDDRSTERSSRPAIRRQLSLFLSRCVRQLGPLTTGATLMVSIIAGVFSYLDIRCQVPYPDINKINKPSAMQREQVHSNIITQSMLIERLQNLLDSNKHSTVQHLPSGQIFSNFCPVVAEFSMQLL